MFGRNAKKRQLYPLLFLPSDIANAYRQAIRWDVLFSFEERFFSESFLMLRLGQEKMECSFKVALTLFCSFLMVAHCFGVTESKDNGWACLCATGASSQMSSNCVTACNCTSASLGMTESEKKCVSNKLVMAILLLCVVLTTIAFLASLACYFYRKDKYITQSRVPSANKYSSFNSATDLLSHQSGALLDDKFKAAANFNRVRGFIKRISCLHPGHKRLLGTITWFSYVELEIATNNFSRHNLIGRGGSSNVYRGHLKDGRVVAVKRLHMHGGSSAGCAESWFSSEIDLISRLNHCHVMPLLGYCSEFQGKIVLRLLVFEYMSNGNLRDCLDATTPGKETLDWHTRVSIALGVAKGLEYLHEAAVPRVLHRDVKSTNILLDDSYRPKITDLGMAKRLIPGNNTSFNDSPARMMGTFGYFAPEYAIVGKASLKSDVFSFGVVILELITGRKAVHKSSKKVDESLVLWATPRLRDSLLVISDLPDPFLKGQFPGEEMQIMAYLARACLQRDPDSRPTMSEVVQILSTISPDKSKCRQFSLNLVLSSSSEGVESSSLVERHDEILEFPVEGEEVNGIELEKLQVRCSLGSAVNICMDNCKSDRGWKVYEDDEIVDLTEPRFESFLEANICP